MLQFRKFDSNSEGEPIARIFDTLVGYALKAGAREIHLRQPIQNKAITVFYLLRDSDELIEQLKMPSYVLPVLKSHLQTLLGNRDTVEIKMAAQSHQISLIYTVEIETHPFQDGETTILKLKGPI